MIFRGASNIKTKEDKDFFRELVSIYIRFVDLYKERNEVNPPCVDQCAIVSELIDIGVISNESEVGRLKELLGDKYTFFINAVATVISNKDPLRGIVSNLYNSNRKKLQEIEKSNNAPTLVDFFCGAGALNYGHNNPYIKEKLIEYLNSDGIIHSLDMYAEPKREFIK